MAKTVYILVEDRDEIAAGTDYATRNGLHAHFVSLSSQAKYELAKQTLSHSHGYDYCDLEKLAVITDDHYGILTRQCIALDDAMAAAMPILRTYAIRPFTFNYYNLKIILDTLKQRDAIISGLCNAVGADNVRAFSDKADFKTRYLTPHSRFSGTVYAAQAQANPAHILPRPDSPLPPVPVGTDADKKAEKILKSRISKRAWLALQRMKWAIQKKRTKGPYIFSLNPFLPETALMRHGIRRYDISPLLESAAAAELSTAVWPLKDHPLLEEMVAYAGPASRAFIEQWIGTNILQATPLLLGQAQALGRHIAANKPVALESRTYFSREEHLAAAQFSRLDIAVIGANHGSLGIQKEKIFVSGDFRYVTDYCVWGDGVKKYIVNDYPAPLPRSFNIHVTGTDHFETPFPLTRPELCRMFKMDPAKHIFIMPGSGFNHNIFYNWYLLMSEQQEYEAQCHIIDFFANRTDCVFIYKGIKSQHYNEYHIKNYIEELNKDHIFYMNSLPLRSLLPAVDAFVTDRPSTSLLEALYNEKICYSCNRWMTFPGDSRALYEQSAQHFPDTLAMTKKIAADIEDQFSSVPRSDIYYKQYGNGLTAKERTAAFDHVLNQITGRSL